MRQLEGFTLAEIVELRFSRRQLLGSALSLAAVCGLPRAARALIADPSTLAFEEVRSKAAATHAVADGYRADVLLRWGDQVVSEAPEFDAKSLSESAQQKQFGYNNDFVAFMPLPLGSANSDHGLLCVNHEYTSCHMMWSKGAPSTLTREQVAVEMAAHGHSIVELRRENGAWRAVSDSRFGRRITAKTPHRISGPAAGSNRMRTPLDPTGRQALGTLSNCCGGVTPWGTVLIAEENFQSYFAGDPRATDQARSLARYGFGTPAFAWARYERRFLLGAVPNEFNRFGWIVEFDPYDPESTPVKRTALGRFKHEGATVALAADGRAVVYSGDDQEFEYVYRFVSDAKFDSKNRDANRDLLDNGTLFVARFGADGGGEWLPLRHGDGPLTAENGFVDQADVLIEARRAADLVGATPMDRPEDIGVNPVTGKVYVMLTQNLRRRPDQVEPASPRAHNRGGHILEIEPPESDGVRDHGAVAFQWNVLLRAGDPSVAAEDAHYHDKVTEDGWFRAPDNCAFDSRGRLWLATDHGDGAAEGRLPNGVWACDVDGDGRALTKLFLTMPIGAEATGPCFTPDERTMFVAVQHPGVVLRSTFDQPATRWPDFDDGVPPRPSVLVITKDDGGRIGD